MNTNEELDQNSDLTQVTPNIEPTQPQEVDLPPEIAPTPPSFETAPLESVVISEKPKNNVVPIIIGVVVLIAIVSVVFIVLNSKKSSGDKTKGVSGLFGKIAIKSEDEILKEQYLIDSDNDSIPDSIEGAVGLDPLVSEFSRCQTDSCDLSDKSLASKVNTLIILDSSGSMGLKIGDETKMNIAKTAIKNYISTISDTESVGLMVYGNKGSNSQSDKSVSCASAEVISPLGSLTSSTVDTNLSQINPVGWTPIGLAIERAVTSFAGKEGQNNQIIIVSDGTETCDSSPVSKAALAYASALKIKVNVIGFAVALNDQSSLSDISTSGGGTFVSANSSSELDAQFEAGHKNVDNYITDATCIAKASSEGVRCLSDVSQKVSDYFYPLKQANTSNGKLYNVYADTDSLIFDVYSKKTDELMNAATKQFNERENTLLDQ